MTIIKIEVIMKVDKQAKREGKKNPQREKGTGNKEVSLMSSEIEALL